MNHEFKAGDVVRIREWNDMAAEYGVVNGVIQTPYRFTTLMAELCGREATIREISGAIVRFKEFLGYWNFDVGMIEHVHTKKQAHMSYDEFILGKTGG